MNMKNYIELAEKKAGKQINLANMLNVSTSYIRMVKAGKKGFSTDMCIELARYIGEEEIKVVAASNLVTEKDERKRKIFESCLSKTANFTAATFFISIILIMTPSTANASWTTVSSSLSMEDFILCYIRKIKNHIINNLQKWFFCSFPAAFQRDDLAYY